MRSVLASSPLVRLLGDGTPPGAEAAGMDFAERLSLWVSAFDAIGLQAAHQSLRALRAAAPAKPPAARTDPPQDLQRVRAVLARLIAQDLPAHRGDEGKPAYAPFHERHLELQRQMELMIGPLRAHVRETLARVAPRLRQLAALDAALAQVLAPREQALLPALPALLRRRFERSLAAQQQDADWLDTFTQEWRQALLAELDLRLAPTAALVEALGNESRNPR